MIKINYRDIIKTTVPERKDEYINFFFENIVGTNIKPIYGKDTGSASEPYFDIAIVKNSQEKKSKIGNKYIERYWRTCIFYFIDREKACEYLNDEGKEKYCFSDTEDDISWESTNGFKSKKINSVYAEKVNHKIFKYFKIARSSWFVRSYVYFVLIICDKDTPITTRDFYIHYWNNNYAFKKAGKSLLFGKSKNIVFAEDVHSELTLINDENKDSLDCVLAYLNKLDFFHENEEAYVDIKSDIDSGVEYVLCQGAARTGKTVLAMRLLHDYPNYKLLLINYNFYVSLKDAFSVLGAEFPYKRIFHHDLNHRDGCWIYGRLNKTIAIDLKYLIVDEAQRLGMINEKVCRYGILSKLNEIEAIINTPDHGQTIFFGDDSQRLNPEYDQGFSKIKETIGDRNYREYYFRTPLGVPPEIIKNVRFLLGYDGAEPCYLNQFSISIEKDPDNFAISYFNDHQKKKHLVVPIIGGENIESLDIGGFTYKNYKSGDGTKYLFNEDIKYKYFLTAYSVISREIESVYLYIPKHIFLDDESNIKTTYINNQMYLINHLYTIMTRSTMSLTICCEDENLAEYFHEKIAAIYSQPEPIEQEEVDNGDDYDVFIAYFGTNDTNGTYQQAKRICDVLKKEGLKVFLYNYSYNEYDSDVKFSETWHVISRSSTMIFVFNEYVKRSPSGLIERKEEGGEISRIFQELNVFEELISLGERVAKNDAKFYYVGTQLNKYTIYPFLNRYIPPLTQGNSSCCFVSDEEMIAWVKKRFINKEE